MSIEYHLEKYHGTASRHTCPSCGRPRCFTWYVDEDLNPFNEACGVCDHVSSCGYRMTPGQFRKEHPDYRPDLVLTPYKAKPYVEPEPDFIPYEYVRRAEGHHSDFVQFFEDKVPAETLDRSIRLYHIGGTRRNAVVFWQIDYEGRVRTGKVMYYGSDCHRLKDLYHQPTWAHSIMKQRTLLPKSFEMVQCLFGEHLLKRFPSQPVMLVEAEKTAFIGSLLDNSFLWLATGGIGGLTASKARFLKDRVVRILPDTDGLERWQKVVATWRDFRDVQVLDCLNSMSDEEEMAHKIDIADKMLLDIVANTPEKEKRIIVYSPFMQSLMKEYPVFRDLVEEFGLEEG